MFNELWVSGVGGGGRGGGKIFCCTICHASATVAAIVTASVFIGIWGGSGSRTVECAQDFMVRVPLCARGVAAKKGLRFFEKGKTFFEIG